jgi:hypothetical protein
MFEFPTKILSTHLRFGWNLTNYFLREVVFSDTEAVTEEIVDDVDITSEASCVVCEVDDEAHQ